MSLSGTTFVYGLWGAASNDVWATGTDGHMLHWDGNSWTIDTTLSSNLMLGEIWGSGPGDIWAVANTLVQGGVIHRVGTMWETLPLPSATRINGVWSSAP